MVWLLLLPVVVLVVVGWRLKVARRCGRFLIVDVVVVVGNLAVTILPLLLVHMRLLLLLRILLVGIWMMVVIWRSGALIRVMSVGRWRGWSVGEVVHRFDGHRHGFGEILPILPTGEV